MHAAGHDLSSVGRFTRALKAYVAAAGTARIGLVHVNDSRDPVGSKRDRHASIGTRHDRSRAVRRAVLRARGALRGVPFVVETADTAQAADIASRAQEVAPGPTIGHRLARHGHRHGARRRRHRHRRCRRPHRGPRRAGVRQPRRHAHDHRRRRHRGRPRDHRRRPGCPASPRRCASPRRTSWSSAQNHAKRTTVRVGGVPIGPDTFTLIAGPVRGRDARADARIGADGQARRRDAAARRRVQAAHLARTRSRGWASRACASWPRCATRCGCRSSPRSSTPATSTSSPSTPTCCRSAPATCRTSACCRPSAAPASRSCSSAG